MSRRIREHPVFARTFGLRHTTFAHSSEHSVLDLRRRKCIEFIKTLCINPLSMRLLHLPSIVVLLNIQGICAGFRAKTVAISGHLPTESH